jgi:hypothetical protein
MQPSCRWAAHTLVSQSRQPADLGRSALPEKPSVIDDSQGPETTYRFATFAAKGTITLQSDVVHIKTRTHLGWWEQTIPLADLTPTYGKLTVTPQLFFWACFFAVACIWGGIYGLLWGTGTRPQVTQSVLLAVAGFAAGWYLIHHRSSEWIVFNLYHTGARVSYTRQGPDSANCEQFTNDLVNAIQRAHGEQNKTLNRSGGTAGINMETR